MTATHIWGFTALVLTFYLGTRMQHWLMMRFLKKTAEGLRPDIKNPFVDCIVSALDMIIAKLQ